MLNHRADRRSLTAGMANVITRSINLDCERMRDTSMYSPNPDALKFYANAQIKAITKKFTSPSKSGQEKTKLAAITKFESSCLDAYNVCRSSLMFIQPVIGQRDSASPDLFKVLDLARSLCYTILEGPPTQEEWFMACRHGPGTSLGVGYKNSHLSGKFQVPVTVTEEARPYFLHYCAWDPAFLRSLIYPTSDLFVTTEGLGQALKIVEASRLTTVPKTDEIDRVIAVEPTANMFLQQGLGRVIMERLKPFIGDFRKLQPIHRQLALEASCTRKLATIDFSSASDRITLQLMKWLIPPIWFKLLTDLRCKMYTVSGEYRWAKCFATMGNATTFPVETLVFYCLAVASYLQFNRKRTRSAIPHWDELYGRISVFGDDCILPSDCAPLFITACEACGLKVNEEKSFFGPFEKFRESCGGDYFAATDVRPHYMKAPRSVKPSCLRAWLHTQWNGILKKAIVAFGSRDYVYASRTLAEIGRLISEEYRGRKILVVPSYYPDDAGVKLYGDLRLLRLFFGVFSPLRTDVHGTTRFCYLSSVKTEDEGAFNEWAHLWQALKFPRSPQWWQSSEPSMPWEVLKMDSGYRVGVGADCTDFGEELSLEINRLNSAQ